MHCKMWKYNYECMCMSAVCMCMRTRKREHFYLILLQLHWLFFCEAPLETLCSTRSGALNLQHFFVTRTQKQRATNATTKVATNSTPLRRLPGQLAHCK